MFRAKPWPLLARKHPRNRAWKHPLFFPMRLPRQLRLFQLAGTQVLLCPLQQLHDVAFGEAGVAAAAFAVASGLQRTPVPAPVLANVERRVEPRPSLYQRSFPGVSSCVRSRAVHVGCRSQCVFLRSRAARS